jgi:translation initiation factor IF-2
MLDLKANPNKNASGTVIESELDKGRGYVSTILVRSRNIKCWRYCVGRMYQW